MIWVVGGTTEALNLGKHLNRKPHIITYGTKEGAERGTANSIFKRMDRGEMEAFIKEHSIDLILDVSHPFAKNVTENVRSAAERAGVKYLRYERKTTPIPDNALVVESFEECYGLLKDISGVVFFSTGSNNVSEFEEIRRENRFIYRILPTIESIIKVRSFGVGMEDIVAMMGPFSVELNIEMLKFYDAKYMVMKDSGAAGGTADKIKACEALGVIPIVIGRSDQDENSDWETFLAEVDRFAN